MTVDRALDTVIKNLRVVRPNRNSVDALDIGIKDGKFARLAPDIRAEEANEAIDGTIAATWGKLAGEAETRGVPLPVIDGLIAATGLAHDLTIATRNVEDFNRWGARCFNPWMHG